MTALSVSSLAVSYGHNAVLRDVSMEVPAGSLVAVLGPSGCGKTTLLRAIAGFLRPDSGVISVNGRAVFDSGISVPPERRAIGYVPQEGALFPHLDVAGNISFGLGRTRRSERVSELLELVGLSGFEHRRPHELSGGQQQRVALARALAPNPAMILLDEPFAALDMSTRMEVRDDVRRVLRAAKATALLVTHDRDEALGWADLVAVVDQGRIVQVGTPVEVYLRPHDISVARAVGETVELPAVITVDANSFRATCSLGAVSVMPSKLESGILMLRPSQFRLAAAHESGFTGVVVRRSFTGEHTEVDVLLSDGTTLHTHLREAPPTLAPGTVAHLVTTGPGVLLPDA